MFNLTNDSHNNATLLDKIRTLINSHHYDLSHKSNFYHDYLQWFGEI